jgi:hypothetical protein
MPEPVKEWVDSSNIEALGYDADAQEVWVWFRGGRLYIYIQVPQEVYDDFYAAPSKGSFLNRVLKPNFQFRDG